MTIQCFHCERELEPVMPANENSVQPYGGLIFTAHGNFGSKIYDPFSDAPTIIIVICDGCIVEHEGRAFAQKALKRHVEVTVGPLVLAELP